MKEEEEQKAPWLEGFQKSKKNIELYSSLFRQYFGNQHSLKSYYGGNALEMALGFDIMKFEEDLKIPEDESITDFITRKYGKEANDLINTLIK